MKASARGATSSSGGPMECPSADEPRPHAGVFRASFAQCEPPWARFEVNMAIVSALKWIDTANYGGHLEQSDVVKAKSQVGQVQMLEVAICTATHLCRKRHMAAAKL